MSSRLRERLRVSEPDYENMWFGIFEQPWKDSKPLEFPFKDLNEKFGIHTTRAISWLKSQDGFRVSTTRKCVLQGINGDIYGDFLQVFPL